MPLRSVSIRNLGGDFKASYLDDILNVMPVAWRNRARSMCGRPIGITRQEQGVLLESFRIIIWPNREDCWERKLQLLDSHSLKI